MPVLLHDILISLVGVACQEFPADVPKRDFLVSKSLPDVLEGIGEDISGEVATRRCSFVHQGVSLADDREIGIVFWTVKGYACSDGLIRVVNCHIPLTDHDIAQRQVVVHDHRSPSLVVNTLQHFQTLLSMDEDHLRVASQKANLRCAEMGHSKCCSCLVILEVQVAETLSEFIQR